MPTDIHPFITSMICQKQGWPSDSTCAKLNSVKKVSKAVLENLTILQVYRDDASVQAKRAVRFAAGIAFRLGAKCAVSGDTPELGGFGFYDIDERQIDSASVDKFLNDQTHVILIHAGLPGDLQSLPTDRASCISVELAPWHTEETLFAVSGLAHLLGDPKRAPLVPAANYGAHTIGYAVFAAVSALSASLLRYHRLESAVVDGEASLSWVNWKAAVAGELGQSLARQGEDAEWPVLPCKDGHVAFVYTERDWDAIVDMIGDPILREERFATFKGRADHRDDCMAPIRNWCSTRTKAELTELFSKFALPCAPVQRAEDLFTDPLLMHRETFGKETAKRLPKLPHRIEAEARNGSAKAESNGPLPLSGIRVLDLGIITAGAGVSALLADMGAEVIKVESETYPDPFRSWAGASTEESPLFKSNNRNKKGLAIDLKTEAGLNAFLGLVKTADIVVENFRRGVLDRLGLTFDRLRAENPNILLASISGQGLTGPGTDTTTFGSTLEASSGFASLTCYDDGLPVISGRNLNYPDQIICLYGAAIIAAQVVACRQSGLARHIDVSQRDCAIYQIGDVLGFVSQGGQDDAESVRSALHPQSNSSLIKCEDGHYVAVSIPEVEDSPPDVWGDLIIRTWVGTRSLSECLRFQPDDALGISESRSGKRLVESQQESNSEAYLRSPNGARVKGFPFQFSNHPMTVWGDSPAVGEHTSEILSSKRDPAHVD